MNEQKRCSKCGRDKDLTAFTRRSDFPHLYKSQCDDCSAISRRINQSNQRKRCPERDTLRRMVQRCHNSKNPRYGDWGGKGIRVCDEWRGKGGFERFLARVGGRPTPEHSIDRFPNQDGNYEPGNVRWATQTEQMNNIHNNVWITANDKTLTLTGWQEVTGIDRNTLDSRYRRGWTDDEINKRSVWILLQT